MRKKVSLETVARRAGVAKSTVSFVLNDKANVATQTREKVWAALKELGYIKESPATTLPSANFKKETKDPNETKNILIYVNPTVRENEVVGSYMAGLREYATH